VPLVRVVRFIRPAQLLLVCLGLGGCAEDLCESQVPAFQVDLTLDAAVARSTLAALWVDVNAAGKRHRTPLDVVPLRDSGVAAFVVVVGDAGVRGFEVDLTVLATDRDDQVVAQGHEHFSASGDACNYFSVLLRPAGGGDGGV
jgi:hypothetical protein